MTTSSVNPTVLEKYKEHAALTAELAKLEYVQPALKSAQNRVAKLEKEAKKREDKIPDIQKKTKSELKDYEELTRSTSKRFFIRLTSGKKGVDKKVEKEEREWLEADSKEKEELQAIATLKQELEDTKRREEELQQRNTQYETIRKQLDELYEALFGGVNQDWPEEDAAEERVNEAQAEYKKTQEVLNKASQVSSLLVKAEHAIKKVVKRLEKAEETSLTELMSSNRLYEIYEHPDLRSAKKHLTETETFLAEARGLRPSIKELGKILIPLQGEGLELVHAEVQLHKLINAATKEACKGQARIEMEAEISKQELKEASKEAGTKAKDLEKKKTDLELIRRSIFEKVHNGGVSLGEQAPWVPVLPEDAPSQDTFGLAPAFPTVSAQSSTDATGPISFPTPQGSVDLSSFPIPPSSGKAPIAGGFRTKAQIGGGEPVISGSNSPPASPTSPVSFPNAPNGGFSFPSVAGPAAAHPGFRVNAETSSQDTIESPTSNKPAEPKKGIPSAIVDATFPTAVPWGLNPYAASVLWNAAHESRDKSDSLSMPLAPGDATSSSQSVPDPNGPTMPSAPSATIPDMPSGPSSAAPSMPFGPPSTAPTMPMGPPSRAPSIPAGPPAPLPSVRPLSGLKMPSSPSDETPPPNMPGGPAPGMPSLPSMPVMPSLPSAPSAASPATGSQPVEGITKKMTGVSLKDPGFTASPQTTLDLNTSGAPPAAPVVPPAEPKKV